MSFNALMRRIWKRQGVADANLVRMFVSNLRGKIGDPAANPRFIFNERAVGYRMARPDGA